MIIVAITGPRLWYHGAELNNGISFNRDAFGQISGLIDVTSAQHRYIVGQQLEGDDH
jgi:hypothetical protein